MTEQPMLTGKQAAQRVYDALNAAGLSRNSNLNGGELTGWTKALGSTGFSVRKDGDGVTWHMVISGKAHLAYRDYQDVEDDEVYDLHEPVDPERLLPAIIKVFEGMGLSVQDARYAGHQTMWDDDVDYEVTTNRPDWLSASN